MALPDFNMRQLLDAGVHFGHQVCRWNPKMEGYIFGSRNGIHIIDLAQTVPLLHQALKALSDVAAKGGRVLFVGTKRQASEPIAAAAKGCAQYYVNHRWLGGMLTNWETISRSIRRLRELEEFMSNSAQGLTKKEQLQLGREHSKLERALSGIKDMGGIPDLLFVLDTKREQIAIKEAIRLKIPVAAILDTNCDPDGITYPVPGNDDASRSIAFYCDIAVRAVLDGISRAQSGMGKDIGAAASNSFVRDPEIEAKGTGSLSDAAAMLVDPVSVNDRTVFVRLRGPDVVPDDLTVISGIDSSISQALNDFGIYHYWQLAALKEVDVDLIESRLGFGKSILQDKWIRHSSELKGAGDVS